MPDIDPEPADRAAFAILMMLGVAIVFTTLIRLVWG
jgi:hypothetical protein